MVETIIKHTCDGCKKEITESKGDMFSNSDWLKVTKHSSWFYGIHHLEEHHFCSYHCLSLWASEQHFKKQN